MKTTLNDFIARVRKDGLLATTHFYVVLPLIGNYSGDRIIMMCDGVNLPGWNHSTTNIQIFGENREMPYMPTYPQLDLSFLMDRNFEVRDYFQQWSNKVIDRKTRSVGYYTDYAMDMDIYVTDKQGKIVYAMKVYEAYPKNIADISLDSSSSDIMRLKVTLAMKFWEPLTVDSKGNVVQKEGISNLKLALNNVSRGGLTLVQPGLKLETLGANLGGQFGSGLYGFGGPQDFTKDIKIFGSSMGSEIYRNSSSIYGLMNAAPGGTSDTSAFGSAIFDLGKRSNELGSAIGAIGEGLSAVAAPAAAVGYAMSNVSAVLGTVNTVANTLGLGTPFTGVQSQINAVAGKIATVSKVAGLPGQLGAVGSSVGAIGGVLSDLKQAVGGVPGGSAKIQDAFGKLGEVFSSRGAGISQLSDNLASGVKQNLY